MQRPRSRLAASRGALADGAHALHQEATANAGNISRHDLFGAVPGTSSALEMLEPRVHQDLYRDGVIGLAPAPIAPTVIESFGSSSLVEVGTNYFLYPVGGSSGPELSYAGAPVVAGTSSALEMLEPSFHQDLNVDGVIGLAVMSGGTVEVSSAYSGPATFMGSSGILQLDQSASFSGTVVGMTGQDTLDLRDISFATIQSPTYLGTSTGGTLSVSDGKHNAEIALLGNYLASTFVASSDGHGGDNVVDPSATTETSQTSLLVQHESVPTELQN